MKLQDADGRAAQLFTNLVKAYRTTVLDSSRCHAAISLVLLAVAAVPAFKVHFIACLQQQHYALALLNLLLIPAGLMLLAFPVLVLVRNLSYLMRSADRVFENSEYYACRPRAELHESLWPQVTIQMPVYTEDFETVIRPALLRALRASQGKANIVVYDDGLMVFADDDLQGAEQRIAAKRQRRETLDRGEAQIESRLSFYRAHGIAFVARSRHGRTGLFKKASNLNFGMNLADAVEARIGKLDSRETVSAHALSLEQVLETYGSTVAAEGEIRLGELLVLLDKDSEMPEGVIAVTIPEFLADESLAYTQHRTRAFNTEESSFARLIGRHTEDMFYVWFSLATRDGEAPPLMGHSAFLRTSSLRAVARKSGAWTQYWEEVVSEDFDLAQRLMSHGYHGRYIAFAGMDFGEGVTRTYSEQIQRLNKFAFGASEMLFNPLRQMPSKGVFSPTLRTFLRSPCVSWSHKFSLIAYLASYFAIALPVLLFPIALLLTASGIPAEQVAGSGAWILGINFVNFTLLGGISGFSIRRRLAARPEFGMPEHETADSVWVEVKASLFSAALYAGAGWACLCGIAGQLLGRRCEFRVTNMDALVDQPLEALVRETAVEARHQLAGSVATLGVAITACAALPPGEPIHLCLYFIVLAIAHLLDPFLLNPMLTSSFASWLSVRVPLLVSRGAATPLLGSQGTVSRV